MRKFIYIVESPNAEDLRHHRYEKDVLTSGLALAEIPHHYNFVSDLDSLSQALQINVFEEWVKKGVLLDPILHISAHGNDNGISLLSGQFIDWFQLRQLLLPLLNISAGKLLICMSTCSGISAVRLAMYEDDHKPFWALVGSSTKPSWADAATAFLAFYQHLLLREFDLDTCVGSMCVAAGHHNFTQFYGSAVRAMYITVSHSKPATELLMNLNQK